MNSRTLEVMKEELVELNKERFGTQFGLGGSNQVENVECFTMHDMNNNRAIRVLGNSILNIVRCELFQISLTLILSDDLKIIHVF